MTWHWSSYEEFKDRVVPVERENPAFIHHIQSETRFQNVEKLAEAFRRVQDAIGALCDMGFAEDSPVKPESQLQDAFRFAEDVVLYGETMLAHHKRLAKSNYAEDFLYENDLLNHWDRYSRTKRIFSELRALILSAEKLCEGYYQLAREDESFLVKDLELPDFLEKDFVLARNLFSVGFDEVGVLIAGRGLEGVLRQFAKKKGVQISQQGKTKPAHEAEFKDIIEVIHRLRWRRDRSRVIDQSIKSLLDFLRHIRNSAAHSDLDRPDQDWREIAVIVASKANSLWKDAQRKRARLVEKVINKDW